MCLKACLSWNYGVHEVEFMVLLWFDMQTVGRCFGFVYPGDPLSLIPQDIWHKIQHINTLHNVLLPSFTRVSLGM